MKNTEMWARTANPIYKFIIYLAFITTVLVILNVSRLAGVGVDLTDEGYYLNWISNPWIYKYYVSQFGFVYHPIYKALGNSIINLRLTNLFISFGLSWLLCFLVLRKLTATTNINLFLISCCLALPSLNILMITGYWLPTPSYNSLNFQGCLIVVIGLFLTNYETKNSAIFASILIGLGGWLVFMAKPSSALVLAVTTLVFLMPTFKKAWPIFLGAAFVSFLLLVISALLIDGSIPQFIKRFQGGFLLLSTLSDGYGASSLIRLDLFKTSTNFKLFFLLSTLLITLFFHFCECRKYYLSNAIFILITFLILYALLNELHPNIQSIRVSGYHSLILLSVPLGAFLSTALTESKNLNNKPNFKFLLLLLFMPYVYAVGTGNNYWQTASGALIFWILVALLFLSKEQLKLGLLTVLVVFVVAFSSKAISIAMQFPYRQSEAIFNQSTKYTDTRTMQTLMLSKDTSTYLKTINNLSKAHGFKPNTPVIDLTGHHPGALYSMQAKAIGLAWMSGGHPKSNLHVEMALYQASCLDIASAWLLLEKDGRRRISESVLNAHGIITDKTTYLVVGKFESQKLTDAGAINTSHPDGIYQHYLLKPVDVENQIKNCTEHRNMHLNPLQG